MSGSTTVELLTFKVELRETFNDWPRSVETIVKLFEVDKIESTELDGRYNGTIWYDRISITVEELDN